MAKMFVEGGAELNVPPHLDGIVAAGYPRRILARVIDSVISSSIYLIFFLLPVLLVAHSSFHHADQVLVGRDPEALDAYPGAELVSIDDSERTFPKIHMALTAQSRGAIVEDMYSTHGVSVTFTAGKVQTLTPGSPLMIPAGSMIHFAERTVVVSE